MRPGFLLAYALALGFLIAAPVQAQDVTPPKVTSMFPPPASTRSSGPPSIRVTFNDNLDPATVTAETVLLQRSGGDGTFTDGNEVSVVPTGISVQNGKHIILDLSGIVLPDDTYRVRVLDTLPGNALAFDGSDDVVTAPQWMTGTGSAITLECWARPLGSGSSDGNTVIHRATNNDTYLAWAVATNTFEFSISLNEKATSLLIPFSFGTWYHVAGTYDGANVRLYINGALANTHPIAKTINWDTGYLGSFIGGNGVDPYNKFQGELDEVRIWTVTRSQAQIQQFMKRRLTGSEAGLRAYYRLDEGTGQATADQTPVALHAVRGLTSAAASDDPAWITSGAPLTGVTDTSGNLIDGEFTVSFPSGNGIAGGNFVATFVVDSTYVPPGGCGSTGAEAAGLILLLRMLRRPRRS